MAAPFDLFAPGPGEFLAAIWGNGPHSLCWMAQGGAFTFDIVDDPQTINLSQLQDVDAWIGAHPLKGHPARGRGDESDVAEVVAIPADLDWAHPTRRTEAPLPSEAEVRDGLRRLGSELAPSVVIESGHGLQPWWLLAVPISPDEAVGLIDQLGAALAAVGLDNGRSDLASILRLPGTRNHKGGVSVPVDFGAIRLDRRFTPEYMRKRLPAGTGRRSAGAGTKHRRGSVTDGQQALCNLVVTRYGGHSIDVWRDGSVHIVRPGKPAQQGSSASIIVGDEGDALLTVFSDHWDPIGKTPGDAEPRSWVLGIDGELHHPGDPLARFTINVTPPPERDETDGATFDPVDLRPYLEGRVVRVTADLCRMTDGRALLHRSRLNGLHGDSGAGKSWLATFAAREELEADHVIMIIDLEDTPDPLIERLRQIGVTDSAIASQVIYVRPDEPFDKANVGRLIGHIVSRKVGHVFIETLGEAFSLEGLNEDKDVEVAPWLRRVCRRIIAETGAGMTLVDHGTKSAERPLDPSGSKRKRAAITGTGWLIQAVTPFDRVDGGMAVLLCAKDRHGWFKRGDTVARLVMDPVDPVTGRTALRLEPPMPLIAPAPDPAVGAVIEVLVGAYPEALSQGRLVAEVQVAGHAFGEKRIRRAADQGVVRRLVRETSGPRGSRLFQAVIPQEK